MDTQKFLLATIVGSVVAFAAGFLIFGLGLARYMEKNIAQSSEPNLMWIIVGHVLMAAAITYIFQRWAGIKTVATGAKAGAIIGLLIALASNLIWLGASGLFTGGLTAAIVDALAGTVIWAVTGAAVGWMLGRGE